MDQRFSPSRSLSAAVFVMILAGAVCVAPDARARVAQINIIKVESPTFGGATFGSVGAYERIEGTITGEVDPKDRLNADIVDISRAPKNAKGKVSYSADSLRDLAFSALMRKPTTMVSQLDPGNFIDVRRRARFSTGWENSRGARSSNSFTCPIYEVNWRTILVKGRIDADD